MPKFACGPETENKEAALVLKALEGQTRQEAGGAAAGGRRLGADHHTVANLSKNGRLTGQFSSQSPYQNRVEDNF